MVAIASRTMRTLMWEVLTQDVRPGFIDAKNRNLSQRETARLVLTELDEDNYDRSEAIVEIFKWSINGACVRCCGSCLRSSI